MDSLFEALSFLLREVDTVFPLSGEEDFLEFFGLLLLLAVFGVGSTFFFVVLVAVVLGLSTTFSGVKAGGAVGLRCRLP